MRDSGNLYTIYKYKKSIYFDLLLSFVPEILVVVFYVPLKSFAHERMGLLFFCTLIISIGVYLISDILFLNRSLGKRIYHIQIFNSLDKNQKVLIHSYIYRRILEATINPRFVKTFYDRSRMIDNLTGTYIGEYIKKK